MRQWRIGPTGESLPRKDFPRRSRLGEFCVTGGPILKVGSPDLAWLHWLSQIAIRTAIPRVPKGLVAGHAFVLEAIVDDYLIREGEIEFSKPIARAVLRDRRLSFGARGLFIFVWDLPAGWRPNIGHLSRMGPERKDAIRSRLRELQNVGAIRFEPIQSDDGKLRGTRWILVNPQKWARISPLKSSGSEPATEDRKIRESVGQTLGDPDATFF